MFATTLTPGASITPSIELQCHSCPLLRGRRRCRRRHRLFSELLHLHRTNVRELQSELGVLRSHVLHVRPVDPKDAHHLKVLVSEKRTAVSHDEVA